ncbi:hypothetical protein TUM17580_01800 [Citrobacter farmeri]|nr:hypothetical protein TUM17580_01800 [Citrobacter farmeri]
MAIKEFRFVARVAIADGDGNDYSVTLITIYRYFLKEIISWGYDKQLFEKAGIKHTLMFF